MSLNLELTALAGLVDHEAPGTWGLSASPHFPRTRVLGYHQVPYSSAGDWNSIVFAQ